MKLANQAAVNAPAAPQPRARTDEQIYPTRAIGTPGRLAIFVWTLLLVLLPVPPLLFGLASVALLVTAGLYPKALRRSLRWQWLVLLAIIFLGSALWGGERDAVLGPIHYSTEGVINGAQMALRAFVIFTALDGLSMAVEIAEMAGFLERAGLRGLGFSVGVAMNLLPGLQRSSQNAWHSLRMRGGLRKQRWRGLQLLAMTIAVGALRRSEDIALAAEARAFTPEKARCIPLKRGRLDGWLMAGMVLSGVGLLALKLFSGG